MNKPLEIRGSLLGRNTLLNFIGQAAPLLVGVITIPFIVRGLGTDRFGLLSLAWVVLGYFTIFDLGLGRATTKFVAEALGKGEEDKLPQLVWTAVTSQALLGLAGALVLMGITPLLVERILNIPTALMGEAKAVFYLLALSLPVVLVSGSFSGVLEAAQRFDLVNAVRIPSSISTYLLTLVGLLLGFRLPGIVTIILISRLVALLALMALDLRIFPELKTFSANLSLFLRLFTYGSWVTVSNVVAPFLRYLDRFMIGALLTMSAVAYYSAPFDIMERIWIIPASLVTTLFPAFSTLHGLGHNERTQELLLRSVKYLIISTAPIILTLIAFARPILQIWLGEDFAQNSTLTFQILLIGAIIGILAPIPGGILQGYGRPDIIAKLYLLYLPLNIALVGLLVKNIGLPGAALSFALRALLDTVLLFLMALRPIRMSLSTLLRGLCPAFITVCVIGFLFWLITWVNSSLILKSVFIFSVLVIFALVTWHWVLSDKDRVMLWSFLERGGYR